DDRRGAGDEAGAGGDRHETGDDARGGTEARHVAVTDLLDDEPGETGGSGGEEGVEPRLDREAVGGEGGAGVEAEPAEPEDAGTEEDERHRVWRVPRTGPTLSPAEDEHRGERRDAGVDVDHRAAGEVQRPTGAEPAGERL